MIDEHGIELVRVVFADQHGILRGKTADRRRALRAGAAAAACTAPSRCVLKDTSGPHGRSRSSARAGTSGSQGSAARRPGRWSPTRRRSGSCRGRRARLGALRPPLHRRHARCRSRTRQSTGAQLDDLAAARLRRTSSASRSSSTSSGSRTPTSPPPRPPGPVRRRTVSMLAQGYQLLRETASTSSTRWSQLLRRTTAALDLPLRSLELEFGPSQVEFTFGPQEGLRAADDMMLFRSAVKQICRRHGLSRDLHVPAAAVANTLRQRLAPAPVAARPRRAATPSPTDGGARCCPPSADRSSRGCSPTPTRRRVFTTPTINGYKRYRPVSLAPDRAVLGDRQQGRDAAGRGLPGDPGTRIENRVGEPAANPYLYMASQMACGLEGIEQELDPPAADRIPLRRGRASPANAACWRTRGPRGRRGVPAPVRLDVRRLPCSRSSGRRSSATWAR